MLPGANRACLRCAAADNARMPKRRRRRLRVAAGLLLAALLCVAGAYRYHTDPQRLRAAVLAGLETALGQRCEVGSVAYSPWGGMQILDLVLAPSHSPRAGEAAPPPIRIASLRVVTETAALLRGQVRPTRIEIDGVQLPLVLRPPSPRPASPTGDAPPTTEPARAAPRADLARDAWRYLDQLATTGPEIDLHNVDVSCLVIDATGARTVLRETLDVRGRRLPRGSYQLDVRFAAAPQRDLASLSLSAPGGVLSIYQRAPLWADVVTPTLPPELAARLAPLLSQARVQLRGMSLLRPNATRAETAAGVGAWLDGFDLHATLEVGDIALLLPDARFVQTQPQRDAFHLADTTVELRMSLPPGDAPGEVRLHAEGRVDDAPTTLTAELRPVALDEVLELAAALQRGEPLDLDAWGARLASAEVHMQSCTLPTIETHPALANPQAAPEAIRTVLAEYRPQGRGDLTAWLLPPEPGLTLLDRVCVDIDAHRGSARYVRFPYPFDNVSGAIRLRRGRLDFDLRGGGEVLRLSMVGTVNSLDAWTGVDLTFRLANMPINQTLYESLPPSYKSIWEATAPLGVLDAVVHLHRPDGPFASPIDAEPDVTIAARILAGSLQLGEAGRLERADGELLIGGGKIVFRDLHGYLDGTAVTLDGEVRRGEPPEYDLRVQVADLPVASNAAPLEDHAGTAGQDALTPTFAFNGVADVWGRVYSHPETGTGRHLAIQIKDGELRAFDPSRPWTGATGWIVEHADVRHVESLAASQGPATLAATGYIPLADPAHARQPLDLRLDIRGPALETVIPQFIPPEWRGVGDALGLSGGGTLALNLSHAAGQSPLASVQVQAARMRSSAFPVTLHEVSAAGTLGPGRCDIRALAARWERDGRIEARAEATWAQQAMSINAALRAEGFSVTPELVAAMPAALREQVEATSLRGGVDLDLDRLAVHGPEPFGYELQGRAMFRDASMTLGLDWSELNGSLVGAAAVGRDGAATFDARLELVRALAGGRRLTAWRGRVVRSTPREPVQIRDLAGKLGDGDASGEVWIDPTRDEFELRLTFREVTLEDLLPPENGTRADAGAGSRPGRADGRITLRGRGDSVYARRGDGELRIRGAAFGRTPLLVSVWRAGLPGRAAGGDTIDQADLRFRIVGSELQLTRVELTSPSVRLVGTGRWDTTSDTIDLSLVAATPEAWPRIERLTEWFEQAGGQILQFRVTGTMASPQVSVAPLRRLDDALRRVLRGE